LTGIRTKVAFSVLAKHGIESKLLLEGNYDIIQILRSSRTMASILWTSRAEYDVCIHDYDTFSQ